MTAPNINTLWARSLVDELARSGLRQAVISPGSRSTPLVAALFGHPDIQDWSVIDERQAAFFALGLARATSLPTAVVCTSGTAAANFYPAICEASRDGVPLLILTADRPAELQDCGASQAMNQQHLYSNHVRAFYQLAQPEALPEKLRYLRSLSCRAYARSLSPYPGPVHLNLPFRKPLEPIDVAVDHRDAVPASLFDEAPDASSGRPDGRPYLTILPGKPVLNEAALTRFIDAVNHARRPLILAGADPRGKDYASSLIRFARAWGAPILAEPTSGQRFRAQNDPVVSTADFLFESGIYQSERRPDFILRTGRAPLGWAAQRALRSFADIPQFIVGSSPEIADPDHIATAQIICDEAHLFDAATAALTHGATPWREEWTALHVAANRVACDNLTRALAQLATVTTAHLWDALGRALPEGAAIFVSNSMPIRDIDSFLVDTAHPVDIFFNRGVNGIDGILSTGLGVAAAGRFPTVIVTGDVALRHDFTALLLARELGLDATIVVCDNDGGAIFDYLPIADFDDLHRKHFVTPTRQPALHPFANTPDFADTPSFVPSSVGELQDSLTQALDLPGLKIITLKSSRAEEKALRDALRRRIALSIDEYLVQRLSSASAAEQPS